MSSSPSMESKSFFANLFDFGFTSFITLRFMKWIYAVLVVLILIVGFVFVIGGLLQGNLSGILLAVVVAPVLTLLYLVLARVGMEIIALFFRIGENTSRIAAAMSATYPPGQGWGGPTGGPTSGPTGGTEPFGPRTP